MTNDYHPYTMHTPDFGEFTKLGLSNILQSKLDAKRTGVGSGNGKKRGYEFDVRKVAPTT